MKAFTKIWFKPTYQREGLPEVEFELQPLDQRTLYTVQADVTARGIGVDGTVATFEHCVTDWKGLDLPFSARAKREVLNQVGDMSWTIWLAQISVKSYTRALLTEDEAKNS